MSAVLKFSCKEKNQIIAHSLRCDGSLDRHPESLCRRERE
jgi:hypothetical protein